MCVDYRSLNKQTRLDMFPIPHTHNLLDKFGKARIFSANDVLSMHHQVHIKEGHEHKTAFWTPVGLFEYVIMPLGLTNAPATLYHLMNLRFQDLLYKCVTVYLDDILIFSKNLDQHLQHLRLVFEWLRKKKFMAKW